MNDRGSEKITGCFKYEGGTWKREEVLDTGFMKSTLAWRDF